MRKVQLMEIEFRNGQKITIRGVFFPERRMIYEIDRNGDTKAVYNFDDVRKIEMKHNGNMNIVLVGGD